MHGMLLDHLLHLPLCEKTGSMKASDEMTVQDAVLFPGLHMHEEAAHCFANLWVLSTAGKNVFLPA